VNPSLRRSILRALKEGDETIESLVEHLGVDAETLEWHMRMLEHGFCVERVETEGVTRFVLTQEGLVVDYVEGP